MTVKIFYPDPATRQGLARSSDYLTAYNAASCLLFGGSYDITAVETYLDSFNNKYSILRMFLYFDTSSIGIGSTIMSARLIFPIHARYEDDAEHADVYAVEGIQSYPFQLTDYGAHRDKNTPGGILLYEDMKIFSTGFDSSFLNLNALGISWINKGGMTKFCLRVKGDIDALPPSGEPPVDAFNGLDTFGYISGAHYVRTDSGVPQATSAVIAGTLGTRPPVILEVNYDGLVGDYPQVRFQYGLTTSYGTNTPWQKGVRVEEAFSQNISGLTPETLYHFRAQSASDITTRNGADRTFTTQEAVAVAVIVNKAYALAREEL